MRKRITTGLAMAILGMGILNTADAAMNAQQQQYFNLLKGKMLSNVDSVTSGGVRGGETTVGVGVNVTLPGMGKVDMDVSSKTALHLCSDGSYIRTETDNAMGIKSASRETGKWSIGKADSAGFALLLTKRGSSVAVPSNVSFDGERTMFNNERWYRLKSSACK